MIQMDDDVTLPKSSVVQDKSAKDSSSSSGESIDSNGTPKITDHKGKNFSAGSKLD